VLVDDPWSGGAGYQGDVGKLTIDQVLFRLMDRKQMKMRRTEVGSLEVTSFVSSNGTIKGRSADGSAIEGRVVGESVARRLMREAKEKRDREAGKKRKRR